MFLLNDQQIQRYVEDPSASSSHLRIKNFDRKNLQHTFYCFRLGSEYELRVNGQSQIGRLTLEKPELKLKPNAFALITSHETFDLSDRVIGIFGQTSQLTKKGIELIHSPFIDPLFEGRMSLGVHNLTDADVTLVLGERLGKITFFDISDTYPVQIRKGSQVEKVFAERKQLPDDHPVPTDDDEWS